MAIIKCKMCGGDLNILGDETVVKCEYCDTTQTIPTVDNEKKITLFTRANRSRFACEFDRAAGVYETIVAEFPEEAEAYWGLVLCKYGIEYVDDPATGKKIPTCHRSSFDSVMQDSNFELVMEYADSVARKVYRDEAKAIEELRKGIIEVSGKEEPYDIFICYKETAENGERTLDSVLAQDVYDALTAKDYRVFFSRITLEDKLGQEYEPYIFAALNSAKIMLAFGTDYDYYQAVWVKNEWSRYLQLMAKDKSKHLIPCYKGIDAYDMPNEFAKLQAQDLGKVGAVQDLLRGIEKLMPRQEAAPAPQPVVQQVVASGGPSVVSYLKRGHIFLEDKNWESADEYFEKALDIDPENGDAYVGKFCVERKYGNIAQLAEDGEAMIDSGISDDLTTDQLDAVLGFVRECDRQGAIDCYVKHTGSSKTKAEKFLDYGVFHMKHSQVRSSVMDRSGNFAKAMRYGTPPLKAQLEALVEHARFKSQALCQRRNSWVDTYRSTKETFDALCQQQKEYHDEVDKLEALIPEFEKIAWYPCVRERMEECTHRVKLVRNANAAMLANNYNMALTHLNHNNIAMARTLLTMTAKHNYLDSREYLAKCDEMEAQIEARKQAQAKENERVEKLRMERAAFIRQIDQKREEAMRLKDERSKLGFFDGKRKKELDAQITQLEMEILDMRNTLF